MKTYLSSPKRSISGITSFIRSRLRQGTYRSIPPAFRLFARGECGASAIEFAITAPVFLFITFGMIAYAIYFGTAHSVQQIAADAARTAIVGMDETERQGLVTQFITANASSYTFIEPAKVSFNVGDSALDINQLAVSISYDASNLPIWNILPPALMPSSTITRKMEIRVGGL